MFDRKGQLLGNYRLVRLLGQGGFSDVYLGEHIHLNTYTAIKILRTQLAEDGTDAFREEARTLAHLKHPNIVQVLDFGVEGMMPYFIMQYASNGTLRQRHPRGVPVALNVVVSYVQQMASALQYAHNQKLIHRDIKPENMLIGEQNQILLSDFGIAIVTASARAVNPAHNSSSWEMAGTASYMAPEQVQGKMVPASDQYALAIVVYEWLTGAVPFSGSYIEVVSQQISASPASLHEKMPSISPDVDQVVLTALNKDPQRRFRSIEAFANALKQAAQSTPVAVIGTDEKEPEVSKLEAALIGPLGRIVIGTTKVTIGRTPDNIIVLSDAKASSHHAEIWSEGQYYNLADLGSTNGTFVNEQKIVSGVPRQLRTGDMVRIGETRFTFEVSSGQQGFAVSDGSTMRAMPPQASSSALPNPGGNTNYGMGNANYGESSYQPTIPAQPAAFTPPQTPYPDQRPMFTPTPPPMPYASENQMPTYISPSSYGQSGQQPSYTPQLGGYGQSSQFPVQQPPYTPPVSPPVQPPKTSPMRTIMLAVIALLVVLAGVGGFFLYHTNQVNQQHANATATAQTSHNNATATALTQQNATATTFARINLTATAVATSPYSPFTKVALDDGLLTASSDWSPSSTCQFASTGFQVSIAQANTIQHCLNSGSFGEMAYQVTMNISQGDCGGLDFRFVNLQNFYFFIVCQNGTYNVGNFVKGQSNTLYVANHASSQIPQGLNKPTVIAVTLQGDTVNMYVNGKLIDNATSAPLTSSAFSQGSVGLFAEDATGPTTVTYTNALVWTM